MPSYDDEDEGNTSFVPLSLADITATAPRTYSRNNPPPNRTSRPSHAHQPSLAVTAKERSLQAKKDAAAMMASLGITDTPVTTRVLQNTRSSSLNNNNGGEADGVDVDAKISKLRTELSDKDQTIESLRKQVSGLMSEKMELNRKVERLERDKAAAGTGRTFGAGEMEDLEKAFASQEALLGGYQRDAEKSFKTIEDLKQKQRRLATFLEKNFGAAWEENLSLHLDRPSGAGALPLPTSNLTPQTRHKLTSRPSLVTTPSNFSRTSKESYTSEISDSPSDGRILEEGDEMRDSPAVSPIPSLAHGSVANDEREEQLRRQLESVHALLRGMERRIIAREVELEAQEKRAKEGMREAEKKRKEVEELLREKERS